MLVNVHKILRKALFYFQKLHIKNKASFTFQTLNRPPILFQRQTRNGNVHIEEIHASDGASNAESATIEHQSPSSSQTITTIASINRLDDNEITQPATTTTTTTTTSPSLTHDMATEVTSLISQNGSLQFADSNANEQQQQQQRRRQENHNDENVVNHFSHETLNWNNNSSRSSIRCTTAAATAATHSDRTAMIICNKENSSVSFTDHNNAADNVHCINVNISNMTELNKALMSNSQLSTTSLSLKASQLRDGHFLTNDGRCESGIR